jgi:hypothetical protein
MDCIKCLKPGGLIIFVDPLHYLNEDQNTFNDPATSTNPQGSWHHRMILCKFDDSDQSIWN